MTKLLGRAFALWLPFVVAVSGCFLFCTWSVQQSYREGLDDPQIQMAEDTAQALLAGADPTDLIASGKPPINMVASLAPWLAVYDVEGKPVASSATLDGALPQLPTGVFDMSTWNRLIIGHHLNRSPAGENRISWQPRFANSNEGEVREAVVLVHYQSVNGTQGYVAAGRNMRIVEWREGMLQHGAAILWGGTALGTLIVIIFIIALGWF